MIEIVNASKYYKDYLALHKVDLIVEEGEVVGILGANGAGKTTLLKAICNLVSLTEGEVMLDGESVKEDVYNKISFITEEGSYFPYLTPEEHEEFLEIHFEKFNKGRFNKLLDYFKINRNKKLDTFSKGEKAKFEVVCGFSKGAKYILMDEPFLGNDVFTRRDFLKLMIGSLETDETLIIATHLIDEIENLLSRAVILEEGGIKEIVTMEELEEKGMSLTELMKTLINYDESEMLKIME
jgi:ABC-2 type transport system ATP-binding protein